MTLNSLLNNEDAQLYFGAVRHARYAPRRHKFSYRVFSLLIDLDRLDHVALKTRLFSHNRFNLYAIYDRDHGYQDHRSLRGFVDDQCADQGLPRPDSVLLLCYPRILGYVFNPLSVYYIIRNDALVALLYEVRNTFGEKHIYFTSLDNNLHSAAHHTHSKDFHVSPFIGMQAEYHFSTALPSDEARLVIRETQDNAPLLITSFFGKRVDLSDASLLRACVLYPLMTLKIIFAIHFEALRLFLKGIALLSHPRKQLMKHAESNEIYDK